MEKVRSEDSEGEPMSSRILSLYCRSWLSCAKAGKTTQLLLQRNIRSRSESSSSDPLVANWARFAKFWSSWAAAAAAALLLIYPVYCRSRDVRKTCRSWSLPTRAIITMLCRQLQLQWRQPPPRQLACSWQDLQPAPVMIIMQWPRACCCRAIQHQVGFPTTSALRLQELQD